MSIRFVLSSIYDPDMKFLRQDRGPEHNKIKESIMSFILRISERCVRHTQIQNSLTRNTRITAHCWAERHYYSASVPGEIAIHVDSFEPF
jgi:hypothetical protein